MIKKRVKRVSMPRSPRKVAASARVVRVSEAEWAAITHQAIARKPTIAECFDRAQWIGPKAA